MKEESIIEQSAKTKSGEIRTKHFLEKTELQKNKITKYFNFNSIPTEYKGTERGKTKAIELANKDELKQFRIKKISQELNCRPDSRIESNQGDKVGRKSNVKERGTCVSNEEGEVIKPEMMAKEVNS